MSSSKKAGWRQKVAHEMAEFLAIAAFLAVLFVSITTYRMLLVAEYRIGYFEYGYAVIEALVLAKIILIGKAIGLGERFQGRPLIYSTIHQTLVYGLLVVAFTLVEHVVGALVHGRTLEQSLSELSDKSGFEILSRVVLMLIAFLPLFAVRSISRVLGEGKLVEMFFLGSDHRNGRSGPPT